jgi:hypothetical protein
MKTPRRKISGSYVSAILDDLLFDSDTREEFEEKLEEHDIPFIRWNASEEAWADFRRKHPPGLNSYYSRIGGMPGHDIMWALAPFGPKSGN